MKDYSDGFFFVCWTEGSKEMTRKYPYMEDAITEAERLAKLPDNFGMRVYVLSVARYCIYEPKPIWTTNL